ncbi:MAG: HNH endonuclease [Nitrospinae bacterium]|nr:HNH endonuclease [Nitrospinota bacterium]
MPRNLDVHHIVPFRLTRDNGPSNLIPLCKKCHKRVETIIHDLEMVENDWERMKLFFWSCLKERQLATLMYLKFLLREHDDEPKPGTLAA